MFLILTALGGCVDLWLNSGSLSLHTSLRPAANLAERFCCAFLILSAAPLTRRLHPENDNNLALRYELEDRRRGSASTPMVHKHTLRLADVCRGTKKTICNCQLKIQVLHCLLCVCHRDCIPYCVDLSHDQTAPAVNKIVSLPHALNVQGLTPRNPNSSFIQQEFLGFHSNPALSAPSIPCRFSLFRPHAWSERLEFSSASLPPIVFPFPMILRES